LNDNIAPAKTTAVRGALLTYVDDPFVSDGASAVRYESDAMIVMAAGKIIAVGSAAELRHTLPADAHLVEYHDALILPGFIDCHVHYTQTHIIAAYGRQLVDWLERYAFVAEQKFSDTDHGREVAQRYLTENLRNGITSAAVFCTVHPQSVDAFFTEAERVGVRVIAGKVLMDRNAPPPLCDTAQRAYDESKALIGKWHGRGRLAYAVTPRFAPTSTAAQLEACGAVKREFPSCYVQSHVSESRAEVAWVTELFPETKSYLDVYDRYGLLGERTIYGHGVHLTESEWQRCHDTGTAIAHCPTSNNFLGSGLFDMARAKRAPRPVRVGLATDLGGGTSFSIMRTLNEAYKVAQLNGFTLSPHHAFYLATRGGAHALYLEDTIGTIASGMEADLVVLDLRSTPLIDYRMRYAETLDEALFIQMMLGDDRAIRATYVAGELVYARPS
jgi:guanine deaminase